MSKKYKILFCEYSKCSSIHGIRYLGESNRFWIEKIFWVITFIISITFCVQFINYIWLYWSTIPVIITFSDKSTRIWKIPLPTLTICPEIKTKVNIFNFTYYEYSVQQDNSVYDNWTMEEKNYMDINLQICEYTKTEFEFSEKLYKGNFIQDLLNISPTLDDIIFQSSLAKVEDINELFYDISLTENGICFSFNLLPLNNIYRTDVISPDLLLPVVDSVRKTNWTVETGYTNKYEGFPFRTYSSYIDYAFTSDLFGNYEDVDLVCNEGDGSFKFAISTPGDIPQLSNSYTIPFNYEVLIDILPEMTTTSDSLYYYSPKIRHCFFEKEKYLKFFNIYSQANCELECLSNYTLNKCGCVRFFMPRTKDTQICGAGSINCFYDAKSDLLTIDSNNKSSCNCLPSCNSLNYKVGVSQAPWHEIVEDSGDIRFWSFVRTKLYSFNEFAADVGGLMGLFMGFSILSFVEIIYFWTLRLYNNIRYKIKL